MPAASPPTHTRHAAPPHHSTSRALSTLWLVTPAPLPLLVVTAGHSLEMCKGHCSHQGQMRPTHCAPRTMLGLNDPRVSEFLSAVPSAPHAGPHARIQPSLAPSAPSSRRGVDRLEVFFSSFSSSRMRETTEQGEGGKERERERERERELLLKRETEHRWLRQLMHGIGGGPRCPAHETVTPLTS